MRSRDTNQARTVGAQPAAYLCALAAALLFAGCSGQSGQEQGQAAGGGMAGSKPAATMNGGTIYEADLATVNAEVPGNTAHGTARVTVRGDSVVFDVDMAGLAPDMMHMQHLHLLAGGNGACATMAADANGDGYVDDPEAEKVAGAPLVPLDGDPVALDLTATTYPTAGSDGSYHYHEEISLSQLQQALRRQEGDRGLPLDQLVLVVHGVNSGIELPDSVAAPDGATPQATLPVACGKLERASS